MKKFWVEIEPFDKKLVTTALESGAAAVRVPAGHADAVRELGKITIVADDGDLRPGKDVVFITIKDKQDEAAAARIAADTWVVVTTTDWAVIPLENLIAQRSRLVARVRTAEEARLALTTLERGVDGVLLASADVNEIKKTAAVVTAGTQSIELATAKITGIRQLGMGDRVCVDTCSALRPGQGMLVGNSSGAMFLVHSESIETPYVNQRPFRVNAGPVHAYISGPDGKTPYLSDLRAGDTVLAVDCAGNAVPVTVGRVKIERRPLLLVEAEAAGQPANCILQNAETILLTDPTGGARSVVSLKPGDEVLIHVEAAGRHFGMKVEETIEEK